ncbi:MAG: amidohydrolase family protein [Gemmataceae bacterium]
MNTRPGFSPHAPYSVHRSVFSEFWKENRIGEIPAPVAIHFQESAEEVELIERRSGPFVQFLRDMGVWEPEGLIQNWDEIERIDVLLVHGNFIPPGSRIDQPIVYCPRTHAAFGHPPHPFRTLHSRGLGLGTDSLASNPDLSVLEEARFIARRHPDYDVGRLLQTITLDGATILGWGNVAGSLTPGKSADFVVLPLPNREEADPHRLIFDNAAWPSRTMFQGKWITVGDS